MFYLDKLVVLINSTLVQITFKLDYVNHYIQVQLMEEIYIIYY